MLIYSQASKTSPVNNRDPDPQYRLANLVRESYWLMRSTIDARPEPMGLSHALWRPLLVLHGADGPMTQTALARALGLESPTLVRLLDRLTEKGWIERRSCPGDRRAYHVALTPHALGLCAAIEREVAAIRHEAIGGIRSSELLAAISVLERVRDGLAAIEAGGPPAPAVKRGRKRVAIE